eukprot:scaffold22833_cov76-Phaeocystis_antarctica.AAC.2
MRDALAVVVLVTQRALTHFQVATMRKPVQNAKKNGEQQETAPSDPPSDRRSQIPRAVGFVRVLIRLVIWRVGHTSIVQDTAALRRTTVPHPRAVSKLRQAHRSKALCALQNVEQLHIRARLLAIPNLVELHPS